MVFVQGFLHGAGKLEVFPPEIVAQPAAVRADDKFKLRRAGVLAAEELELVSVRVLHRVAVHVEHKRNRGVLLQVAFDRRERAVISARIARVIIKRAVVHHADAALGQRTRHLVADADHVAVRVQRAKCVGHIVLLPRRHGIALGAVGVNDEHLRLVRAETSGIVRAEHGRVERGVRAVVDVHIAEHRVARGIGRLECARGHAVFRHGDLVGRFLLREHRALVVLRIARRAVVRLLRKLR